MERTRGAISVILAVMLAAVLLSVTSLCAANANAGLGKVDVAKVWQSHSKVQQAQQELMKLNELLENRLMIRDGNRLLTEDELTELQTLKEKASTTDAEKNRIKQLEDLAKQRDVQLRELIAKQEPSETDRALLAELQARNTQADKTLGELVREYDRQLKEREAELMRNLPNLDEDILKAIQSVAQAQNLGMVVNDQAVLYGGTDITDAVVERLNKQ